MRQLVFWTLILGGCSDFGLTPDADPPAEEPEAELPTGGIDKDTNIPDDVVTGGILGTICETKTSGLKGVHVLMEHEYGVAETVTDEDGRYELLDIPAGDYVLVLTSPEYFDQLNVWVPPNEVVEMLSDECFADCDLTVPCVGLAEAVDRNSAVVSLNDNGINIRNTSDTLQICLDEWIVVLSDVSQDAGVGQEPMIRVMPGKSHDYVYSADVYGGEADEGWWCLERWQYTAPGSGYEYNGSLLPKRLFDYVHDRTDTNRNGVEDHVDRDDLGLQTQHNLWNTEADNPLLLVGRASSLVELTGPHMRKQVTVQVRNLGQKPGSGTVIETIEPGFNVFDVQPPAIVQTQQDGSTTLTWTVALEAAKPDFTYASPTIYDQVDLSYRVSATVLACEGRCLGNAVAATWQDSDGSWLQSYSEPLVIEHCPIP